MSNNNLSSLIIPVDQAAVWAPKPVNTDPGGATASDHSGSYTRSTVRDGEVVGGESGKTALGSSSYGSVAATAAANVPYEMAIDPVTRCRVSPDQVKDDTILHFPGLGEVTARQAREHGWLAPASSAQPTPTNGLLNNPLAEGQQQQQKEEQHPDLQGEAFADAGAEQQLTSIVNNTSGHEQFSAIQEIVNGGEITERTLGTLATQVGIEPGELQQRFAPVMAAFEAQGRAVMGAGGINADDVIAFAQQHQPDRLRQAMHKQATQRSTTGYAALRQEYLESLADHNPAQALNADLGQGFTQRQDAKGRVIVRLPTGVEVEWRNAIKAFGPK